MAKSSVEEIKLASNGLRGQIAEGLVDPALTHYEESENVLMKFPRHVSAGRSRCPCRSHEGQGREGLELHGAHADARWPDDCRAVFDP